MRVVHAIVAQRLRTGWRGWAALTLLIGIAGGAVLAAAAGARRTDSAYPRFLKATAAANVLVSPAGDGVRGGFDFAVAHIPGVEQIAPVVGLNVQPVAADGKIDVAAEVAAPLDDRYGHLLQRPKMLEGRQPNPLRPAEVMVDQIAARQLGVRVGSVLRLAALSNEPRAKIRYLSERVVGIDVTSDSIVPVNMLAQTAFIQASAALYRQLGPDYQAFDGDWVTLSPATSVAKFTAEANALVRQPQYKPTGGQLFVADERTQAATVEQSIRPQAVALAIFALVLALTALLVLGHVATRLLLASSADNPVLTALGVSRRQLASAGLLLAAVPITAGAVLACIVAVAASPLLPIGPARLAELSPGLSFDATVLLPGVAVIDVLLVARLAWTAWRESSVRADADTGARPDPGYASRTAGWLAGSGAPVTVVTGVRMALERQRGRSGASLHGVLIGIVLSVAAVMGSVTFGANLTHLERTPRLYGQTWDAAMDLQFSSIKPADFARLVAKVPHLASWTYGLHGTITLGSGGVVPAIGLAPGRGALLGPTMLAGHPPGAGQVVLGALTMRNNRIMLGQRINFAASGQGEQAQVVGRAVFPYFGQGSFTPTDLGHGAIVPAAVLAQQARANGDSGYNFVLVSFDAGTNKAADVAALRHALAAFCGSVQQSTCVVTDQRPNGVTYYDERIDATPSILAAMLAVLGLGVLAQFTFQSARSRRREFAVLRTLGFRRHQIIAATTWQISTLAALGLAFGLPLGVAAGHFGWALFANELGLSPGTQVPVSSALILVPAVLLIANAVGFWPNLTGARKRPAELLRAE